MDGWMDGWMNGIAGWRFTGYWKTTCLLAAYRKTTQVNRNQQLRFF